MTEPNSPRIAWKLAGMLKDRGAKIARLSQQADRLIKEGSWAGAQVPLALLSCEAVGLAEDLRELFDQTNRPPAEKPAGGVTIG